MKKIFSITILLLMSILTCFLGFNNKVNAYTNNYMVFNGYYEYGDGIIDTMYNGDVFYIENGDVVEVYTSEGIFSIDYTYAGYYPITKSFNPNVTIKGWQRYSVYLQFYIDGGMYFLGIDQIENKYAYSNGTNWTYYENRSLSVPFSITKIIVYRTFPDIIAPFVWVVEVHQDIPGRDYFGQGIGEGPMFVFADDYDSGIATCEYSFEGGEFTSFELDEYVSGPGWGHTFYDEGEYEIIISDYAGNERLLTFIIGFYKLTTTSTGSVILNYDEDRTVEVSGWWYDKEYDGHEINDFYNGMEFTYYGYYLLEFVDWNGNEYQIDFFVTDITAPTIVVTNNNDNTITVTYYDNESGIKSAEYYLDYEYMGTFASGTTFSANGEYYFIVEDNEGNIGEVDIIIISDVTPPTIILNNGNLSDGAYTNSNVTVTYSDTGSGIESAEYYLDYEYMGTFVSGTTFSVEGEYYILVEDKAGNISERFFIIDKTAPTAYLNGSTTFGAVTSATITFIDSNYSHATYTFGGSTYTLTNGQVFTASGMYTIKVYDKAGNVTSKAFRVS